LPDFKSNLEFLYRYSYKSPILNFIKIHPVAAALTQMDRRAFVTRLTGAFREYARTSKKFEQNFRSRVTGTVSDVQCDITTAISDVTPLSLVDSSKHSSNSPSFRDEFVYAEDEGSRFFEMSVPKNQITRRHIPEGLITNDLNGADFMSFGINSDLRLPILTNATILVCVY